MNKIMKKTTNHGFVSLILIASILLTTFVSGQTPAVSERNLNTQPVKSQENFYYIEDLTRSAEEGKIRLTDGLSAEVEMLEKSLASNTSDKKGTIIVDKYGSKRLAVIDNLALRLANDEAAKALRGKRLLKINLAQILTGAETEREVGARLETVFAAIEKTRNSAVVIVEDVTSFSQNAPLFGADISARLRQTLAAKQIQVISTGTNADYEQEVLADNLLKTRFAKIDLNAQNSEDSFVGDKISPDLRELMKSDPNQTVKVILQADDIQNRGLRNVLSKNGVIVSDEAVSLNMLILDLPVRVAEEVAAAQGMRHLSLDRKVSLLGHVETTTGALLVRNQLNSPSLLTPVTTLPVLSLLSTNLLDGSGVGIAIVDSSIRDDHRSFIDYAGSKRIVYKVDFSGDDHLAEDEYGHGTHVASLAAGGAGKYSDNNDWNYLSNYRGIAPNAKLINVRVLNQNGSGTTANLIRAMDWLYTNRNAYNIKVVNLSLGSPAVESWRNDPLCRAVRRLTAAGMVVVAAAGNNGKTASGQKIYGA